MSFNESSFLKIKKSIKIGDICHIQNFVPVRYVDNHKMLTTTMPKFCIADFTILEPGQHLIVDINVEWHAKYKRPRWEHQIAPVLRQSIDKKRSVMIAKNYCKSPSHIYICLLNSLGKTTWYRFSTFKDIKFLT